MSRFTIALVIGVLAGLMLVPPALAQSDRTPSQGQAQREGARAADREAFKAPDNVVESRKIVGMRVKDSAGKDLGEIDQLLVDTKTGKVTHAVIGRGGLAGIGETKVVVGWSAVNLRPDTDNRDRMIASMEASALDGAPRYDRRASGADRPAASPRTNSQQPPPQR